MIHKCLKEHLQKEFFVKAHSLGNDVILINLSASPDLFDQVRVAAAHARLLDVARCLADRHTGIGSDGVVFWSMSAGVIQSYFFNADGSSGALCINGARCLAQLIMRDATHGVDHLDFGMGATVLNAQMLPEGLIAIDVAMGRVIDQALICYVGSECITGAYVNVGNPHYLIECARESSESFDLLRRFGAALSTHKNFAQGANVTFFVTLDPHRITLCTYERGCGPTQACSSAVCALATLLVQTGQIEVQEQILFCMPGGDAHVMVNQQGCVSIAAEAELVFEGRFL